MFYYKQLNSNNEAVAVLTCDTHLESDDFQSEITEDEYMSLLEELMIKNQRPPVPDATKEQLADAVTALETLGYTEEETANG